MNIHTQSNHTVDLSSPDRSTDERSKIAEGLSPIALEGPQFTPAINLYQTEFGWSLLAALPQVNHDEISVRTEGATLIFTAPRIKGGYYKRALDFPNGVEWSTLNAEWGAGLLKVDLTQASPPSRVIPVQAG